MITRTVRDLDECLDLLIDDEQIVAIFQGKGEWGPRALGNRSILFDPRHKEAKQNLLQIVGKWITNPNSGGNVISFVGQVTLTPDQDDWMETETLPEMTIEIPSIFDTLTESIANLFGLSFDPYDGLGSYIIGETKAVLTNILNFFTDAYTKFTEFINGFDLIGDIKQSVTDIFDGIMGLFAGDFSVENFKKIFGSLFDIATAISRNRVEF